MLLFFLLCTMPESLQNQFKSWIFPGLVSVMGMMIWNDVTEIKSDVKALMAQSNIDKTRIDNLEREVYKSSASSTEPPYKLPKQVNLYELMAVIRKNELDPVEDKTYN